VLTSEMLLRNRKIMKILYLLDCATRSITLRFATPALLISLFAARISSSASVSWMLFGLFMLAALAP
jgi:hypothetical protein